MALKVLGQAYPTLLTLTDVYTVPGSTEAVISSIIINNQDASNPDIVKVSVAVGGASDSSEQYLYYDLPITNNDTFAGTLGITLSAGDVVRVYSTNGTSSFNLFGEEN